MKFPIALTLAIFASINSATAWENGKFYHPSVMWPQTELGLVSAYGPLAKEAPNFGSSELVDQLAQVLGIPASGPGSTQFAKLESAIAEADSDSEATMDAIVTEFQYSELKLVCIPDKRSASINTLAFLRESLAAAKASVTLNKLIAFGGDGLLAADSKARTAIIDCVDARQRKFSLEITDAFLGNWIKHVPVEMAACVRKAI